MRIPAIAVMAIEVALIVSLLIVRYARDVIARQITPMTNFVNDLLKWPTGLAVPARKCFLTCYMFASRYMQGH